jgi:hypothetical protein
MAAERRKTVRRTEDSPARKRLGADEKIARLLGLFLVRSIDKRTDQVTLLRRAGFNAAEVSSLLNVTENQVAVMEFQGKKKA